MKPMKKAIFAGDRMSGNGRTSSVIILAVAALLLIGGVLTAPRQAMALHDQGYICYTCHSLNPAQLRTGSNSIRTDQAVLATIPPSSTAWVGGMPVSCDFCHRAASDIPTQNMATKAKKHPVDLIQTGNLNPTNEITCNDCHDNGTRDLVSLTLTTKSLTDGYPNHLNVDNIYAHNLTNNPPHLNTSWPYYGATLPGVNRTTDGTFWTSVQTGAQNILCWRCHDGTNTAPYTTGVKSSKVVKNDYVDGVTTSAKGHKIQTSVAGALAVGSALPCYDCHDSHGSVNNALILDNNSIYNDCTSLLAVTTYNQGARPYSDQAVCAGCHDTNNATSLATKAGGIATMVEGMYPVDPYNSTLTGAMHIASGVNTVLASSTAKCLSANGGCHANPHNPVGESKGGQNCSLCHATIYAAMDAGSSTGYHHVMLGDNHVYGTTYPNVQQPLAVTTTRTCLVCHVDHNYFSKLVNSTFSRAKNLRTDITIQPDNTTNAPRNTDYDNTLTNGGICTSCHALTQTKNTPGTNIKNDGIATTAIVSKALFGGSAHNYASTVAVGSGHFSSDNTDTSNQYFLTNCSKCHNDTMTKSFQNSTDTFAMHASDAASAVNNLLAPMGFTPLTDNLAANFCYRCHSHGSQLAAGKTVDAKDFYNNVAMDNAAESSYTLFTRNSKHPLAAVDCLSCHNVHATRATTGSIVANPDNTYAFATYVLTDNTQAGKTNRSNYCLVCHDGTGPTQTVSATTYVPKSIALAAIMNKSTNGARGHWAVSGSLQTTTIQACDACHDKHGSTAKSLLGQFDPVSGRNMINGVALYTTATPTTTDNAAVCGACHTAAGLGYPPAGAPTLANILIFEGYRMTSATPGDNGYFSPTPSGSVTTPRWPGMTVWQNATYSGHGVSVKTGPATLGSRGVADCNGCHDPHGSNYKFNMLTDNMAAGNYKLCFDCHMGGGIATTDIKRYFPTGVGGTWVNTDNNHGHRIQTGGGKLTVGTALPCYDCHVTHGSSKNNLNLVSDQRWNALGDTLTNDNASRTFCLGCHTTSTPSPYDGYGNIVAASDTIEGLNRIAARPLRLPNTVAEHANGQSAGCKGCHYSGTPYVDNTTNNAHNPSSGGGCSSCHGDGGTRYWPQLAGDNAGGATMAWYNNNGKHLSHLTDLAARLGYLADNSQWTDPQQKVMCLYCHEYTADATNPHMTIGGGKEATVFNGVGRKTFSGANDPNAAWDNTTNTCSNVGCHNNKTTTATYNWYTASTTNCMMCHTVMSSGTLDNNPRTGLHYISPASVTGGVKQHDNSLATNGCTECHWATGIPAHTTTSTHINGTVDNAALTVLRTNMTYKDNATVNRGTCQGAGLDNVLGCHTDRGAWARLWSTEADNTTTVSGSARCNVCHGQWSGAGWRDNTSHFNADSSSASTHGITHDNASGPCTQCHVYPTYHMDNGITMNDCNTLVSDNAVSNRAGCSKCHNGVDYVNGKVPDTTHSFPHSGFPFRKVVGNFVNPPAGHAAGANCKGCHAGVQGTRRAIQPEFDNTSRHGGTWAQIVSADCELCHVETSSDSIVSLKVWTTTTNPGATGAVTYNSAYDCTANPACIGCHKGATSGSSLSVGGAAANVDQYWSSGTTTYNSHNNTPSATVLTTPIMAKVRSPHRYPTTNKMKQEVWTTPVNQTKYTDTSPVGCLECHPAHGSGIVSVAQLKGKAFADNIAGGIMLNAAEPALCWNCHDTATVGVKDYWGDTTTAGVHWSGTLKSTFPYKNRAIGSTHEVNGAGTGFKCSICHNPHGATNAGQYNSPMLRGTWMTSPYYEDRTGKNNNTTTKPTFSTGMSMTRFGPRGSAGTAFNNAAGRGNGYDNGTGTGHDGYYIDENTFGWTGSYANTWLPTAVVSKHMSENVANFAGLCAQCHGDATQSTGQVGTIAQLQTYLSATGLTDWSTAIHNTVKGWAGLGTTADRVNPTNNLRMHGYGMTGSCYCFAYSTNITTSWGSWKGFNWQGVPSTVNHMTGANAIHQFPCAKCHTPHASDIPRLMTTNCMDVGTLATSRKAHGTAPLWTYPAMPTQVYGTDNAPVLCHNRRRTNLTGGGGWNKVTGW